MAIKLFLYHFFRLLPIRSRKVLFFSYYGTQYGCSPKYVSQYISTSEPDWDIVWAIDDFSKIPDQSVRKVKFASLGYLYELATAKVLITNYRLPLTIKKRKNQIYVQTWHSSLRLKMIEKDSEAHLPVHYVEMAKADSQMIDYLLAGCEDSKEIFERSFWFDGPILEIGTPRIDPLLQENEQTIDRVKEAIGIGKTDKVLLYAPTFRKGDNYEAYVRSFDLIVHSLKQRWGGEWRVLVRFHPHLMNKAAEVFTNKQIIHVSKYPDIQELLLITDVLMTDYSSLMFDFLYTRKPVLLYLPDLADYLKNERDLYYDVTELPFLKVYRDTDIQGVLDTFDEVVYRRSLDSFIAKIGSYERGDAAERLTKMLKEHIE